ncbi:unnamed protein product [Peronospora belbahrii]|uniref:Uncharacterized protein n=1 Tax=Peronospora belbahrii TaxID=622444 RepID=A0AAU9LAW9_9STRA|nr:unnamed protein product [Peronospora belbahrii]CAH0517318.1 unnamed protein product [Peronospora belbahrii]
MYPLLLPFVLAYVAFLAFLVQTKHEKVVLHTWTFYLLSIGTGLVVLRYFELYLVDLPQVLAFREHPEFVTEGLLSC